ncbi:MAG: ABC transporter substrate-binding protein, partial [Deltaproteobacteria bacterium]|nr:ABC transporter substrate-binding protein [Deltaproteobacteria bacterium]
MTRRSPRRRMHLRLFRPAPPTRQAAWLLLRGLVPLLCCCSVLPGPGCTASGDGAALDPAADRLTVLIEASIEHLDPRFALSAYSMKSCQLIHAALISVDNEASEPRLELAESFHQPDPLTYELQLRPGALFHDGTELTAADVAWTYRSILDPALGSPYAGMYEKIARIEVLDRLRLRFVLKQVHAPFLSDLVMGIVPQQLTRATGRFTGRIVGAGPFQVAEGSDEDRLLLERFGGYFLGAPALGSVAIRTIRDDNSRLLALMGGSGDLVQNGVNPLLLDTLAAHPRLVVRSAPSIAYNYLGFNLEDPLLQRRRVRQAIAHALDIPTLVRTKLRGMARPATGMLAPNHWAYNGEVTRYPYDPERARRLLDEEGLADPDGDGPQPRFRLTFKTTTNRFRRSIARVIAAQLGQVGIAVEVKSFEWGTFFNDVRKGNFQLYALQWPTVVEPDLYHWLFHSSMIPGEGNG